MLSRGGGCGGFVVVRVAVDGANVGVVVGVVVVGGMGGLGGFGRVRGICFLSSSIVNLPNFYKMGKKMGGGGFGSGFLLD